MCTSFSIYGKSFKTAMIFHMNKHFTKLYDYVIESYLPCCSGAEFKLLVVIIKQTVGWQKKRDRISHFYYMKKTALSRRSVTRGVQGLEQKKMIRITNKEGQILKTQFRKYETDLYYEVLTPKAKMTTSKDKKALVQRPNWHITIDRDNRQQKGNQSIQKQSDQERITSILNRSGS